MNGGKWLWQFGRNADDALAALIGIGETAVRKRIILNEHIPAAAGFIPGEHISCYANGGSRGVEPVILNQNLAGGGDQKPSCSAGTKVVTPADQVCMASTIFHGKTGAAL